MIGCAEAWTRAKDDCNMTWAIVQKYHPWIYHILMTKRHNLGFFVDLHLWHVMARIRARKSADVELWFLKIFPTCAFVQMYQRSIWARLDHLQGFSVAARRDLSPNPLELGWLGARIDKLCKYFWEFSEKTITSNRQRVQIFLKVS